MVVFTVTALPLLRRNAVASCLQRQRDVDLAVGLP